MFFDRVEVVDYDSDGSAYVGSGVNASGCTGILSFDGASGVVPTISYETDTNTTTVKYAVDKDTILDSIGTCYSTVIAVRTGPIFTGQGPIPSRFRANYDRVLYFKNCLME